MKLLAIETTGKQGSIVLSDAEHDLWSVSLPEQQRSTQSLVPTIRSALSEIGWSSDNLTHIAVAVGPGSFTGLRVGVTTAKMLAYATGAKIIAVSTLQAIAARIEVPAQPDLVIAAAMDAQRGDLSARFFRQTQGSIPVPITEIERIHSKIWWQKIMKYENVIVASPMVNDIPDNMPHVRLAEKKERFPHAEGVAKVAREKIQRGEYDDIWTIRPFYSRLSAAEEKKLNVH